MLMPVIANNVIQHPLLDYKQIKTLARPLPNKTSAYV